MSSDPKHPIRLEKKKNNRTPFKECRTKTESTLPSGPERYPNAASKDHYASCAQPVIRRNDRGVSHVAGCERSVQPARPRSPGALLPARQPTPVPLR